MRNRARFSGSWYSAAPDLLRRQLDAASAQTEQMPHLVHAGILPHAGLSFSARGMAPFFSSADRNARRVVILAPSHYEYLPPNQLYGERFARHETPLGDLPGGGDLWEFRDSASVSLFPEAIEREHAIEMYLPYISHTLGESARVNAVLVPELTSVHEVRRLADHLLNAVTRVNDVRDTLFIASSDFTHYGRRFAYTPYKAESIDQLEQLVERLDRSVMEAAAAPDLEEYWTVINRQPVTICGRYPISILVAIAEHLSWTGSVCDYYNSNSIVGPDTDFVCYGTVLYGTG